MKENSFEKAFERLEEILHNMNENKISLDFDLLTRRSTSVAMERTLEILKKQNSFRTITILLIILLKVIIKIKKDVLISEGRRLEFFLISFMIDVIEMI